jgi:hypothetical protein
MQAGPPLPKHTNSAAYAQLRAWANDRETEVYTSTRSAASPIVETFRGNLRLNSWGFLVVASDVLSPLRTIALNINFADPDLNIQLEPVGPPINGVYVAIYGRSESTLPYRMIISTVDPAGR